MLAMGRAQNAMMPCWLGGVLLGRPATRLDVINLQEQLDTKLQQRQARETGICPVRRELYSQVFGPLMAVC
jgi:dynein light intermediate chain